MLKARFLRWGIPLLLLAVFALFIVRINQGERIALINREGQTFEKGVVTEILQDNLQPDGSRVGEQRVVVRMTTGVRAGQELETIVADLTDAGMVVNEVDKAPFIEAVQPVYEEYRGQFGEIIDKIQAAANE